MLFIIHVLSVSSERCVWVQVHKSFKGFDEEGVFHFFFLPSQHISHLEEHNKKKKKGKLEVDWMEQRQSIPPWAFTHNV